MKKRKIGSRFAQEAKASENPIFRKNELEANKTIGQLIFGLGLLLLVALIFIIIFIYAFKPEKAHSYLFMFVTLPSCILVMLSAKYWVKTKKVNDSGFKFFLIGMFIGVVGLINVSFPKYGAILWPACIVLASHYYSPRTTRTTYIISVLAMLTSLFVSLFVGQWDANLMNAAPTVSVAIDGTEKLLDIETISFAERFEFLKQNSVIFAKAFIYFFLFRAIGLTFTYLLCRALASRTFDILTDEVKDTTEKEKSAHELEIASELQKAVLPSSFPDTPKGELYALMDPAAQVGGDFYDFFSIDEDHLALVIGDVSGHGIPASLFMMKAESLIKSLSNYNDNDPAKIISATNHALCEGNTMNMFVTCWFGILNLDDGTLQYVSAGHNPPLLLQNGEFKWLKGKGGFILGGMNSSRYFTNTIQLNKGDKLFLYTDGVTEAHNKEKELYSEQRLINFLNARKEKSVRELINEVREDINNFENGAEQFDDITMLSIEYRFSKKDRNIERIFPAKREQNDNVTDFVGDTLIEWGIDKKLVNSFKICVEEIFINIASYAYEGGEGNVSIELIYEENNLYLLFKDDGVEFNPVLKEDPNINIGAEERGIGGLGILMVKKMMDKVSYKRIKRTNYLTLKKVIK